MEIIKKIAKAKTEIKNSKLEKEGYNSFSKYYYFTPGQIEFLVKQACTNNGLLTTFDLIRNELGVYGKLTIYDCDSDEKLEYIMASAIPEIKATNIAQQLGGCVTYTERYLKTSAFGITDNNLDFDTTENTEKGKTKTVSHETKPPKRLKAEDLAKIPTSDNLDLLQSILKDYALGDTEKEIINLRIQQLI